MFNVIFHVAEIHQIVCENPQVLVYAADIINFIYFRDVGRMEYRRNILQRVGTPASDKQENIAIVLMLIC